MELHCAKPLEKSSAHDQNSKDDSPPQSRNSASFHLTESTASSRGGAGRKTIKERSGTPEKSPRGFRPGSRSKSISESSDASPRVSGTSAPFHAPSSPNTSMFLHAPVSENAEDLGATLCTELSGSLRSHLSEEALSKPAPDPVLSGVADVTPATGGSWSPMPSFGYESVPTRAGHSKRHQVTTPRRTSQTDAAKKSTASPEVARENKNSRGSTTQHGPVLASSIKSASPAPEEASKPAASTGAATHRSRDRSLQDRSPQDRRATAIGKVGAGQGHGQGGTKTGAAHSLSGGQLHGTNGHRLSRTNTSTKAQEPQRQERARSVPATGFSARRTRANTTTTRGPHGIRSTGSATGSGRTRPNDL